MKFILTSIALSLLLTSIQAQDSIPSVQPQDTIAGVQAQDTIPAVAPAAVVAPAAQPAPQQAQSQPEKPAEKAAWKKKMYFGGYINLSFGSYTSIGIEPMVGYKIIPRLSVGAKLRYDYVKQDLYGETYTYSNYGGSLFARLLVIKHLYLHAEYAAYNYESHKATDSSERIWVPYFLVGAGFRQPLGGRASLNVQVLFDVLNNNNSPYGQWEPFYSVGMSVGF